MMLLTLYRGISAVGGVASRFKLAKGTLNSALFIIIILSYFCFIGEPLLLIFSIEEYYCEFELFPMCF